MTTRFVERYRNEPRFYLYYQHKNMRDRTRGKKDGGGKKSRWLGMEILPREDFIEWALENPNFKATYAEWQESGFTGRGPTVHRIDRSVGYVLGNMIHVKHGPKSTRHIQTKKSR